eukprot:COSAG01_NODE_22536_length_851_cov_1.605053_1_plen_244_part_10
MPWLQHCADHLVANGSAYVINASYVVPGTAPWGRASDVASQVARLTEMGHVCYGETLLSVDDVYSKFSKDGNGCGSSSCASQCEAQCQVDASVTIAARTTCESTCKTDCRHAVRAALINQTSGCVGGPHADTRVCEKLCYNSVANAPQPCTQTDPLATSLWATIGGKARVAAAAALTCLVTDNSTGLLEVDTPGVFMAPPRLYTRRYPRGGASAGQCARALGSSHLNWLCFDNYTRALNETGKY